MSLKLTDEHINHCRRGSDIDLEAIFGGHISGKRSLKGVKSNPVYTGTEKSPEVNDIIQTYDDGNVDIKVYKNIPTNTTDENSDLNAEETDSPMAVRPERENLKVTNGQDFVGDIVIENGYHNPAYENDCVRDVTNVSQQSDSTNQTPNSSQPQSQEVLNTQCVDAGENSSPCVSLTHDSVKDLNDWSTKNGSLNGHVIQNSMDSERTNYVNDNDRNKENQKNPVLSDANKSGWPDLDDIMVTVPGLNSEQQNSLEIELNKKNVLLDSVDKKDSINNNHVIFPDQNIGQSSNNHSVENHVYSTTIDIHEKQDYPNGSLKHEKKQKIKQRKSSLPESVLNSVIQKPIRPILLTSASMEEEVTTRERLHSGGEERPKSVKFSEDTVFNDNRPNKYKSDKINLKDIYRGRITSNYAVAKSNPLFVLEEGSLTDDEKAARFSRIVDGQAGDLEAVEGEPKYDQLIKRTLARQRRSKLIRLILAFLSFLVVTAVVTLLVIYFGKG